MTEKTVVLIKGLVVNNELIVFLKEFNLHWHFTQRSEHFNGLGFFFFFNCKALMYYYSCGGNNKIVHRATGMCQELG